MNGRQTTEDAQTSGREGPPTVVRVAGGIAAVQGALGLAAAVYLVVHALSGYREETVAISGYGTAAWFTVFGGAVCAAGLGLLRGHRWGRGLAVLAELLLLFVAWYVGVGSGRPLLGLLVGAPSVVALVCLFRAEATRWYAG